MSRTVADWTLLSKLCISHRVGGPVGALQAGGDDRGLPRRGDSATETPRNKEGVQLSAPIASTAYSLCMDGLQLTDTMSLHGGTS